MTLRDLNHWDFFKLVLIIEFLIGAIMSVLFLSGAFLLSKFGVGPGVSWDGDITLTIPVAFFLSIILAMVKASFLSMLCRYTRLGNIQIGNTRFGKSSDLAPI